MVVSVHCLVAYVEAVTFYAVTITVQTVAVVAHTVAEIARIEPATFDTVAESAFALAVEECSICSIFQIGYNSLHMTFKTYRGCA